MNEILPKNWSWVKLGEIAEFKNGINFNKHQKGESGILTIDVYNMYTSSIYVNLDELYRVDKEIKDDYVLKYGDLLFVRSSVKREGVGFATAFKEHSQDVTFCGFIIRARLNLQKTSPEFLTYLLRSNKKRSEIISSSKQVTITNVSQDKLGSITIPLPPLPEQHRIVEKVEELFSELDNGIENLKKSKEQIKTYRQAVLKSAFEGKLTEIETANVNRENGELPEGWEWRKFGELTENFDGKRIPLSKSERSKRKGEFRYYGATGIIDYVDDYIFDGKYLLIGEDGANLLSKSRDLAFIVEGKFWVNNHAHIVQPNDDTNIYYLRYYINSIRLEEYVSGSAQPKLNQKNLNKIPVPTTNLNQQTQIVEEIERRFSVADKMEAAIDESLKKAEALRQSILKQAFEGKLV